MGFFFFYPLARILGLGLFVDGDLDLSPFVEVATTGSLRQAAWFTVWQAVVSTVLTVAVGLPGAAMFARFDFPGKRWLHAAIAVPFVMPTVVVGSAFLAVLGPNGLIGIDLRRSVWAILLAHVFYNYAVVVRTVGAAWGNLDPRMSEAARSLGASRLTTFRRITLPLLRPALAAAAAIVFLFTFTSFGVVLILGGLEFATLEVAIWRETTQNLDLAVAGALAVVQLIGVSAALWWYSRAQERRTVAYDVRPRGEQTRRARTTGERAFVGVNIAFIIAFLGTPLAVLIERSVRTGRGFGLDNYANLASTDQSALFVPPLEGISNSLIFAVGATLVAVVVGLAAALVVGGSHSTSSRWFDVLLMLPLGTSAVTIGFGFLVALDWPIDIRAAPVLIPIAHAIVAVPFVIRLSVPALRSIRHRLREAAAVLGASPERVWRSIDLPIIRRAAVVAGGFAFAISLGEFGATAFIARPDRPTLPTVIFRLLGQPGQVTFGQAMAASTVLMILTAISIAAIDGLRSSNGGEW